MCCLAVPPTSDSLVLSGDKKGGVAVWNFVKVRVGRRGRWEYEGTRARGGRAEGGKAGGPGRGGREERGLGEGGAVRQGCQ